ncbi:MAG: flippase [Paludibacteraceae bacterium]|nr:flippase [Paludibacteraceae bacterium]
MGIQLLKQQEFRDVFYLVLLQGLNYIAPILVFPYLMAVLGAEKFGYISFSLAVCQYLMLIVDFGFNLSATKKVALAKNNQEALNKIFTDTLNAKAILLAISFVFLVILSVIPEFAVYRTTMFIMFLIVIAYTFSFVWLFQGLGQIRLVSIVNTVSKLSILPLCFIFVKSPDDFLIAALIQSSVYIASTVISIGIIKNKHWVKYTPSTKQGIREELNDSFPLFLSIAATSIYTACFIIILGYFAPPAKVGQYAAVDKLMRAFCFLILSPILQAFYPKISAMSKERREDAVELAKKLLFVVLAGMIALQLAMFFGSPIAIKYLGNDYAESDILFKIMSFAPIFIGVGGVMAQLFLLALGGEKEKKHYRNIYLCAGVIALVSVFSLTPAWGAIGTTISLLITELFVCILMTYYGILIFRKTT